MPLLNGQGFAVIFLGGGKLLVLILIFKVIVHTVLEYGDGSLEFIPLLAKLPMAEKQKAKQPCVPK